MEIELEELKELQGIFHEEYGVDLSIEETTVIAKRLLLLFELVLRPLPGEETSEPSAAPSLDDLPRADA